MSWLGDLAFRLTTRRMRPVELLRAGLDDDLAHRPVRVAGPRWFTVWSNDHDRLRRLDTVLLPAPWIGLEEDEMRAIAAAQIQGLNGGFHHRPVDSGRWRVHDSRAPLKARR